MTLSLSMLGSFSQSSSTEIDGIVGLTVGESNGPGGAGTPLLLFETTTAGVTEATTKQATPNATPSCTPRDAVETAFTVEPTTPVDAVPAAAFEAAELTATLVTAAALATVTAA